MYSPTLKSSIVQLAKSEYPNWVHSGRFEKLAFELRYKSSNAGRRCRELYHEGYLERRINEQKCVEYKYQPRENREIVPISREEEEKDILTLAIQ